MDKDKYAPQKKYFNKTYGRIYASIKKDILEDFKEKCRQNNVSQASVLSEFMKNYKGAE